MPKMESYMDRTKRKAKGAVARKQRRAAINKKIGNMGIFKELKKEQSTRSE